MHHWYGPYRIVKKLSPVNFQLRNSTNHFVSTPVHVNRMKIYYDAKDRQITPSPANDDDDEFSLTEDELPLDSFESELPNDKHTFDDQTNFDTAQSMPDTQTRQDNELPDLSDAPNEDAYQIEKNLKICKRKREKQYLVKWLDYSSEQNSWFQNLIWFLPMLQTNHQQIVSRRMTLKRESLLAVINQSFVQCGSTYFLICSQRGLEDLLRGTTQPSTAMVDKRYKVTQVHVYKTK